MIEEEDGLVCDLIDSETKQWNLNIIHEMFASQEAVEISKINVRGVDFPDELVWHYDRKGFYTVKWISAALWLL